MFQGLKNFMRGVGIKLGIIQQLESIADLEDVIIPSEFYAKIEDWKALHRGYHKETHVVSHFTIEKGQTSRTLATMNVPKVVSRDMASLIFNERCEISISAEEKFDVFVKEIFKRNNFNSIFQSQLEYMFAQGGMVVKPYLDRGEVKLSYATADTFVPITWDNKGIREAVFTSSSIKRGKYYTLLEWHLFEDGVYKVKNQLYESAAEDTMGYEVDLAVGYPELEREVEFRGVTDPLFVYFKPNEANNIDPQLPLGVSIYGNSLDTLKSIDIAFDSLQREFRLGRKRIIVPPSAIRTVIDPKSQRAHRYYDPTDETYEAPNIGGMDSEQITFIDPSLRIEEHVKGINAQLNILATQIGWSAGTLSFDASGGLKTATEVISENSKTFRTKKSHENVIEQGIADLVRCIGQLAEAAGIIRYPKDVEVSVAFDDSIIQDKDATINTQILLIGNDLQDHVGAIMEIYGYTKEEAEEKYETIVKARMDSDPLMQQQQSNTEIFGDDE